MNELERRQLLPELQEVDVCEAEPAQAIHKACSFEAATQCKPAEKKSDWKKQSQSKPNSLFQASLWSPERVSGWNELDRHLIHE